MAATASAPSVGIRSKTPRISCSGLHSTDMRERLTPASSSSISSRVRSRNASLAAASRSSTGVAASTAATARRASASRASKPAGEKSVSSCSCPATPIEVAVSGSRAQKSST